MYVPVAFLSHGGRLYAFITNMKGGPDLVHNCEVFVLDEETNTWISRGFIAGSFLPIALRSAWRTAISLWRGEWPTNPAKSRRSPPSPSAAEKT